MLTGSAVGRVTADLEPQTSTNGNTYVRFSIAVDKGYGDNKRTIFPQCWLYGDQVPRIMKAKVKKGSLIWVSGEVDLVEYEKKDYTKDKNLKITVHDWGYVPVGKGKGDENQTDGTSFTDNPPDEPPHFDEIDGDNGNLPG